MTSHRRYYFEHPGPWEDEEAYDLVRELLMYQSSRRWWYNEPLVEGRPFNRLSFHITVSGDNQWQVHHRAMGLACAVYRHLKLPAHDIPTPIWETLEPHSNRGRFRVPKIIPAVDETLGELYEDIQERIARPSSDS